MRVATLDTMLHAAKKKREAIAAPVAAAASLRLSRGESSQITWILEDVPGGTSISIGAAPSCDWQVRAECVPPHAVSVLLLSGNLFVRSTCEGDVLLDGSPLGDNWITVRSGARLDIGQAQVVVARGAARSAFGATGLSTLAYPPSEPVRAAPPRSQVLSTETRLGFPVWSANELQAARDQHALGAVARAALPAEAREANLGADQEATSKRHSRSFAPSLLGDDRPSSGSIWLYVLAGLATLVAYAGWVMALDGF
jgi:hypothetical protein